MAICSIEIVLARTSAYRTLTVRLSSDFAFDRRLMFFNTDDTVADVLKEINYYKLFEIGESASDNEIKKAYRRLSLQ